MTTKEKNCRLETFYKDAGYSDIIIERLRKQPNWVSDFLMIHYKEIEILKKRLNRLQQTSPILDGMDYFTLNIGRTADDTENRPFYTVSGGNIVHVATCGPDDIILIGRKGAKRE
jgi:hypothetical protein